MKKQILVCFLLLLFPILLHAADLSDYKIENVINHQSDEITSIRSIANLVFIFTWTVTILGALSAMFQVLKSKYAKIITAIFGVLITGLSFYNEKVSDLGHHELANKVRQAESRMMFLSRFADIDFESLSIEQKQSIKAEIIGILKEINGILPTVHRLNLFGEKKAYGFEFGSFIKSIREVQKTVIKTAQKPYKSVNEYEKQPCWVENIEKCGYEKNDLIYAVGTASNINIVTAKEIAKKEAVVSLLNTVSKNYSNVRMISCKTIRNGEIGAEIIDIKGSLEVKTQVEDIFIEKILSESAEKNYRVSILVVSKKGDIEFVNNVASAEKQKKITIVPKGWHVAD
jgi:hypothetical protein